MYSINTPKLKIGNGSLNFDISLLRDIIVFLYFCRSSFIRFAQAFNLNTTIVAGIIVVSWGMLFTIYSLQSIQNICWDGIILICAVLIFFAVTIMIHPEYKPLYENRYNEGNFSAQSIFRIGSGIYAFYHIRLFKNNENELYRLFRVIPYVNFFCNIWTFFFNREAEYNMDFGYQMELVAILFIGQFLYERKRKLPLILSLVSMVLVVLYGSRASIVGYGFCIMIYFLWKRRMTLRKAIVIILGLVAVIILRSPFLLSTIYRIFSSTGYESRTLRYLASGNILSIGISRSRQDVIWPKLIEVLKKSDLFQMYGAYGDRQFVPGNATYAHNFILEILLSFGKFFGGIILIWILYKFIKICKTNKNSDGLLVIMFGTFSLCRLFFSSSFWYEPYFWALIAMMINCSKGKIKFKLKSRIHGD